MAQSGLKNLIVFLLIFVFCFSIYFFIKNSLYDSDDISYAMEAESGIKNTFNFWSSQHPLWGPLGVFVYETSRKMGNKNGSLVPLQLVNSFFGALSVSIFFLALYHLTGSRIISSLVSLLFGTSYYFWYWSGSVKHYSVAAFFIVLAIYFLVKLEKGSSLNALGVGSSAGIAVLMHSANIIFFLPAAIAILLMRKTIARKLINFFSYLIGILLFFVTPHLFIMSYFLGYQFKYAGSWSSSYPWFGLQSRFHGFDLSFNLQRLPIFLERFWSLMAGYYTFYHKNPVTSFIGQYYFAFFLIFTGILFLLTLFWLFKKNYPLVIFCLLWIVLQFVGMWLVDPFNFYIFIWLLPVLIIMALSLEYIMDRFKEIKILRFSVIFMIIILIISLFSSNLVEAVIPYHQSRIFKDTIDYYKGIIKPKSTVICSGLNPEATYFQYFTKIKTINIVTFYQQFPTIKPDKVLDMIKVKLDQLDAKSGSLYVDNKLLSEQTVIPPWAPSNMNSEAISQFFKKNYIIEPIPGDKLGQYLIINPKKPVKNP